MTNLNRRIPTGVPGLDEIIGGGIPRNTVFLIAGESGTGKTVLSTQIAYFNSLNNRKTVFVSFDEGKRLFEYARSFGWNLEKLSKEDKFKLLDFVVLTEKMAQEIVAYIMLEVKDFNAELLILDSLTTLVLQVPELSKARVFIDVLRKLKPPEVTIIGTANIFYGSKRIGLGVEEVIADTLILLKRFMYRGELKVKLYVLKMRGSSHSRKAHELVFTSNGVKVIPLLSI